EGEAPAEPTGAENNAPQARRAPRPPTSQSPFRPAAAEITAAARRIRQQILVNQELLRLGMAAADHFALAVMEAGKATDATIFSGVG
ncbi:MAG TPA: hypothetical protein VGV61_18755, partial [Thermoanaerobaculia bacterium]|nr:hypothetical protein [Thermoanaerobaculia bacterium]